MQAFAITPNSAHTMESLRGFSIENTSGAVGASFKLRKETVSGTLLFTVNLAAAESASLFFPTALMVDGAVYVEVDSGTIAGSLLGT